MPSLPSIPRNVQKQYITRDENSVQEVGINPAFGVTTACDLYLTYSSDPAHAAWHDQKVKQKASTTQKN